MLKFSKFAMLIASSLLSGVSVADTVSSTMDVTATVGGVCSVSADGIAFGTVDGTVSAQALGSIRVTCPSGTPYNVALDAGLNYDAANQYRRIQNAAGDSIVYALFDDAGGVEWGDSDFGNTYPAAPSVAGIGTGVQEAITVTGVTDNIPSPFGSVWTPGTSYSDTVFVTVHF